MANFDFKTATPDATFPSGGFLFGTDSQSAATPSIYAGTTYLAYILGLANTWQATQTITPAANTSALAVTGYSLTGSNAQSLVDLAGTWNTTGEPTAIKLNVTNTATGALSQLLDVQVGGTSRFSIAYGTGLSQSSGICIGPNSSAGIRLLQSGGALYCVTGDYSGYRNFYCQTVGFGGDAYMTIDTTNVIAQRYGETAQTQRWYGTYTNNSNYRRVAISMTTGGVASIAPEGAGTGASGNVLHISGLPTSNPGPGILWNNAGTPAIGT